MHKTAILGATGGTGRQLVAHALDHGHEVTAIVRDPAKLLTRHERLQVVAANVPDDPSALTAALRGHTVVISALGRGTGLGGFKSNHLIARSVPSILTAMERTGIRRLLFMSAFGVGPTWQDAPFLPRLFMRVLLRGIYADKNAGEAILRRSQLDWTIVSPTGLTDGPETGRYRSGERLALTGFPTISRADSAAFILTLVDDRASIGKTLLVSQ